jgi:hypothetical protein
MFEKNYSTSIIAWNISDVKFRYIFFYYVKFFFRIYFDMIKYLNNNLQIIKYSVYFLFEIFTCKKFDFLIYYICRIGVYYEG